MTPRFNQGTTSSRFSQLGCERLSRMMFQASSQAESGSDDDRGERDEGRLEQERGLHHPRPESDRAHDADLLPPLDDGSCTDDAERRHAHEQPQPHEALDQAC